jgi:hypothetical protein
MTTEKTILASVIHYANFPVRGKDLSLHKRSLCKTTETIVDEKKLFAIIIEVAMCTLLMVSAGLMVMGI